MLDICQTCEYPGVTAPKAPNLQHHSLGPTQQRNSSSPTRQLHGQFSVAIISTTPPLLHATRLQNDQVLAFSRTFLQVPCFKYLAYRMQSLTLN
jgi:hypothetical protein